MSRSIFAIFLFFSLGAAVAAPLSAQSLADLSKQEEQRRKNIKEPAKVYTNKDLGSVPSAPPAQPSAGLKAESANNTDNEKDKAKDAGKPGEGVKDQAYWAGKVKALQSQLDRDEAFAEALQSRINALTTDFANRSDPAQRAVVDRDRVKALAELDRLKLAILNDKKAIGDLQEDARRAGVPPGWLR